MFERILKRPVKRPLVTLVVVLGCTALFLNVARRLNVDTSFSALLPKDDPVVNEINYLREKAGGTADVIVALGSKGKVDEQDRLEFSRQLVARFLDQPWIRRAATEYPIDFFEKRRLLLLKNKDLLEIDYALDDAIAKAKARANPLFVDLEEDRDPWAEVEALAKRLGHGYDTDVIKRHLTSKDNRYQFIRLKAVGTSYDMDEGRATLARIDEVVRSLHPEQHNLEVRYSGPLPVNEEQHQYMMRDLRNAAILALVLILLLLTVVTRQPATPIVIAIPLVTGIGATLALTVLTIGNLNIVSGFLITALIGIGVDYGIHLYLRYLENLCSIPSRRVAMADAAVKTFPACLTAALTTAAAFLAMTYSDFRGFREYGQIAAVGVIVSLFATFMALPPLAMFLTVRPKGLCGRIEPRRVRPLGRGLAWAMAIVGLAMTIYSVPAGLKVRFHNDFKHKLRGISPAVTFSEYVESSLGGSLAPAAVAVKTIADARAVEKVAQAIVDNPHSEFERVISLGTIVPPKNDPRLATVTRIRKHLQQVRSKDLNPEDRKKLADYLEQTDIQPWTLADLPKAFKDLFLSVDGSLNFVLIWPRRDMSQDNEIIGWANELDYLKKLMKRQSIDVSVLDENRVAARVLSTIRRDGVKVMLYAALAVLALVIIDFRNFRQIALVGGTFAAGFFWTFGAMHAWGMEINVFNMAVLPTVIGVGIDNAVHLMHRYSQEGPGSVAKVVATTGTAALLASVTTGIGFAATIIAHHNGIKSMGELALLGFGCTLIASTALLPAVLQLLDQRPQRANRRPSSHSQAAS